MRRKIVVKFGGSNLKTESDFNKLVCAIRNYNQPLVVVISAFYGVTNLLTDVLIKTKDDEKYVYEFTTYFSELQNKIVEQNIASTELKEKTLNEIKRRLSELEKYLLGIHYIGDVPDFVEDAILSYGEKFSSLVLAAILQDNGFDATEIWPEKMALITNGEFGNATVDIATSKENVSNHLKADRIFIVPGFYGISPDKKVTLLGRGGTDYSAAAIAACINAQSLDIWKDVDGFMSADPKLVENPLKIKKLSYIEAAELAYFGARILHPRTVEPLMDENIPIRIFNIDAPNNEIKPLTVIDKDKEVVKNTIKSVTNSDDFGVLKLRGPGIGIKHGVLAKITQEINNCGINIKSVFTSQITINLLMAQKDLQNSYNLIRQLAIPTVRYMSKIENVSIIALVGEGLLENYGVASRIFSAVAERKINVKMATMGASQVSAYLVVDRADKTYAINEIHRRFFDDEIFTNHN